MSLVAKVQTHVPEKPPSLNVPRLSDMPFLDEQEWYVSVYPSLVAVILAQQKSPNFMQIAVDPGKQ